MKALKAMLSVSSIGYRLLLIGFCLNDLNCRCFGSKAKTTKYG